MKVVFVNSGLDSADKPFDRYIDLTLRDMGVDYRLFDFAAHIKFFDDAFNHAKTAYDIDYSSNQLYRHSAAPLLQLVSDFEPDLVLATQGCFLPPMTVRSMQKMGAVVVLWVLDDNGADETLKYSYVYDYVFTFESNLVEIYLDAGCANVAYLPQAAFPGVFKKQPASHFEFDVCVIGSADGGSAEVIDAIAGFLIDGDVRTRILGERWDALKSAHMLNKSISNRAIYAADRARYYSNAKINLNPRGNRDLTLRVNGQECDIVRSSPEHKTFEIAASGGFQLIESVSPNLERYFEVGREVDIFTSPVELADKIAYYLEHSDEREEMARLARERCLKEHTYVKRLEFILEHALHRDSGMLIRDAVASVNNDKAHTYEKNRFNSRRDDEIIARTVPVEAKRVLEIGCGEGLLSDILRSKGVKEIFGVEENEVVANKAIDRLDKVIIGNIEEVELPFRSNFFDCIIYRGVLENLREPWRALSKQGNFLTASGRIIASIPNTLFLPVIKDFLKGCWRYSGSGTLDGTHPKSFTLREIVYIFKLAGFEIEAVEGITNGRVDSDEASAFMKSIKPLNVAAESLTAEIQYSHYMMVAKKVRADDRGGVGLCLVKS
ncbi:MAG: glycosyltransferase [Actinobacteria bacterium]|nr:glycosyltransferase [Actinomycetota bacterium]